MNYALIHANILTGQLDAHGKMPIIKNATMLIENDRITAIYEDKLPSDIRTLKDFSIIDLEGRFLLPAQNERGH